MTKTEKRFIDRAIRMASVKLSGAPPDIIQRVIGEEIERAIQYASEEDAGELGVSVTTEPKEIGLPQPPLMMPDASPLAHPRTPLVPVEKPSLLILPGQEGFTSAAAGKKMVGEDVPLRVWREPTKKLKSERYQQLWQEAISSLNELIRNSMPPVIKIVPRGLENAIDIEVVNITSDIPGGLVKIEYGIKGQARSHPSQRNAGGGILDAIRIDLVVSSMFCIKDRTVNWEQRVEDLRTQAADVFRPRPKEIINRTPAPRGNELSLSEAAAYAGEAKDGREIVVDSAIISSDEAEQFRRWKESQRRGPIVPPLV